MAEWSHFDRDGNAVMVDVTAKEVTARTACASGTIRVNREVMDAVRRREVKKGDVLGVAQVAGIMAAKTDLVADSHVPSSVHPEMFRGF